VKLLDFGVAKVRGRDRGTLMGSLKGKIRYMAPEQAASQPVDRRTDVYALGIVLWECLTHQRLFSGGDDIEALERVKNPHVASPSALAPQIGPGLDECVMTALAPAPDRRFQTALAFRRAIGGGCPKALEVDAEELASFLVSLMNDEIERQKRELPVLAETGGVRAAHAGATRAGYSMTRESPAVDEAAIRASVVPAVPAARSRRVAPIVAPATPWRPATIALVAISATSVGVAFAWLLASQLAAPAAAVPAPVAAAPPPPVVPAIVAEPEMMPTTTAPALPIGLDPPAEEIVVAELRGRRPRTARRRLRIPAPARRPRADPGPTTTATRSAFRLPAQGPAIRCRAAAGTTEPPRHAQMFATHIPLAQSAFRVQGSPIA
jgi:eukaryotic-like serine/threonine-protein kinase